MDLKTGRIIASLVCLAGGIGLIAMGGERSVDGWFFVLIAYFVYP